MARHPKEVKERAYLLWREGMSRIQIAAYLSEQAGRDLSRKTVGKWISTGIDTHSTAKFGPRWHRRARQLRMDGISYANVAAIIAIESGLSCSEMTVYGWLNSRYQARELRRRRANERAARGCRSSALRR